MQKKFICCLFVTILCFVLVGCTKTVTNSKIVGKWKNDTTIPGYDFIYTFNADGTGKYDAAGTIMNFKYTIDGNKISFEYTDEDMETLDTTFSIDGDVLNIIDSFGEDTLYEKIK